MKIRKEPFGFEPRNGGCKISLLKFANDVHLRLYVCVSPIMPHLICTRAIRVSLGECRCGLVHMNDCPFGYL